MERPPAVAPAPVDLSALVAALEGEGTDDGRADGLAHGKLVALEQRLRQREQELARALACIGALEAATRTE